MEFFKKLLVIVCLSNFSVVFTQKFDASFVTSIGTESTSINVSIDSTTQIAHFILEGPSDKYFAFGFGKSKMAGSYAFVCNSTEGDISERKFQARDEGIALTSSISNLTKVENGVRITFEFDREASGFTSDYFSFNFTDETEIDFIYSLGISNVFQLHGMSNRGITKLFFQKVLTSTKQNKKVEQVSIFPNPAKDQLNLTLSGKKMETEIKVMDMTGVVLLNKKMKTSDEPIIEISTLEPGFYILSVQNERLKAGMSFQKE